MFWHQLTTKRKTCPFFKISRRFMNQKLALMIGFNAILLESRYLKSWLRYRDIGMFPVTFDITLGPLDS